MNSSRSQLKSIIDIIRTTMDEPETNSKYSDALLATQVIPGAMSAALTMLNMDEDSPIVCSFDIEVTANQTRYAVPGRLGMVRGLLERNSDGYIIQELPVRNWSHPWGQGWRIEGAELVFEHKPRQASTYTLEYEVGELSCPHYSTGGSLNSDLDTLTLDLSPDLGYCDFAQNAYLGQTLTIINVAANTVQSRIVTSQTSTSGTITVGVRTPFTAPIATGTVVYELMPPHTVALNEMIAYHACMRIGASRSVSEKRWSQLMQMYKASKKAAIDKVSNLMGGVRPSSLGRISRKGGYDASRGGIHPVYPR